MGNDKRDLTDGLLAFIDESPSCYQAVENIKRRLSSEGYTELKEKERWELSAGEKYYVNRNDSSLIAFSLPVRDWRGFHMIASHSDSPAFKLKLEPEIVAQDRYVRLNVEKYGGMILSTWLDRPLSLAGRVVTRGSDRFLGTQNGGRITSRPVAVKRDLLVIPNLAVHMNREMNKGVEYSPQTDMLPLYGGIESKDSLLALLSKEAGLEGTGRDEEVILDYDLFVYNREKGRKFGAAGEFIGAPRLDDLECVYASLVAMLESEAKDYVNLIAVFDNEEVGSLTRQGAASTFLKDTLYRICEALGITGGEYLRLLSESFMLSADNAHALHPAHPEKADPVSRPYLNGGIVIKYHGGQKYTTDAVSGAVMKALCQREGIPFQIYHNHSDQGGGSTLGNLSAGQVAVRTVDIGLAQLAMHSAFETAGSRDIAYMVETMTAFFRAGEL